MTNQPGYDGTPQEITPDRKLFIEDSIVCARAMLINEDAREQDMAACIWRLIEEAAEVNRSIRAAGPRNQTQHGLEYHHTSAEIWGTEIEMAADGIEYATTILPNPNKAALGRYLEVMSWLQFVRARHPRRVRKMLLAIASGMTYQTAADTWGYGTRQGARAAQKRALDSIQHRLESIIRGNKKVA